MGRTTTGLARLLLPGLCASLLSAACADSTHDGAPGPAGAGEALECHAAPTPTTLYTGVISGAAIVDGAAVFVDDATVKRTALSTAEPEALATLQGIHGLTAVGRTGYVLGEHAVGAPVQGRQPSERALYSVSLDAPGDARMVTTEPLLAPSATDDTTAYFAGPGFGQVLAFKPGESEPRRLDLGKIAIRALAVRASQLYVAGQDFSTPAGDRGVIARIATTGGSATALLSLAGLPNAIAVDDRAIYWLEESPYGTFDVGHLARADLNGKHPVTLAMTSAALSTRSSTRPLCGA